MLIDEIILDSIKSVNSELNIEELKNITDDTKLFELLDSLGTLDLILELESALENQTGRYIAIANENSMDATKTPFETIVTLNKFIQERIDDA